MENKDSKRFKLHNLGSNHKSNEADFGSQGQHFRSQQKFSKSLKEISDRFQNKSKVHPEIDKRTNKEKSVNQSAKAIWGKFLIFQFSSRNFFIYLRSFVIKFINNVL